MNFDIPLPFGIIAFFLLGIERVLYGYCYIGTNHFKQTVDKRKIPGLSSLPKDEDGYYWRCMQRLGMYIKIFQFGVCSYDLLVLDGENVKHNVMEGGMLSSPHRRTQLALGMLLLFIGQVLNYATFQALGAKGVYYGYEFGYPVARVSCFPYNLNISDPQYWGVVLSVFGVYLSVGSASLGIPLMEVFWYGMSMKVFENERGRRWYEMIAGSVKGKSV